MKLWEKTMSIVKGEALLITSEDVYPLQALSAITQLVNEVKIHGHLDEKSGISENCIKYADEGCNLIFQEIQKRLDGLICKGYKHFHELSDAVVLQP